MGSNSIPPKTLSDESINRGLVCAHMHFIARTRSCPRRVNAGNKKHTQHAPSTKTECDYLNGWIKKRSHTQKSQPKAVNARDIDGERKKKDPKMAYAEIQDITKTSSGSLTRILHGCLDVRKRCARWVPHHLSEEQKRGRVDCCTHMLRKFGGGRSPRVWVIVTGDKTWVYQ